MGGQEGARLADQEGPPIRRPGGSPARSGRGSAGQGGPRRRLARRRLGGAARPAAREGPRLPRAGGSPARRGRGSAGQGGPRRRLACHERRPTPSPPVDGSGREDTGSTLAGAGSCHLCRRRRELPTPDVETAVVPGRRPAPALETHKPNCPAITFLAGHRTSEGLLGRRRGCWEAAGGAGRGARGQ